MKNFAAKYAKYLWLVLGCITAFFAVCFTVVLVLVLNSTCNDATFFGKSLRVCKLIDGVGLIIIAEPQEEQEEK